MRRIKGLLIAICGLDGSGKTTQISLLSKWLKEQSELFLLTKQPTDVNREDPRVRDYLDNGNCPDMEVLAMLAAADRKWHLKTLIQPNIENGHHVISDRYLYSSLAFFMARGLSYEFIMGLNKDVPKPDVTIFLDVQPSISIERVRKRDGNNIKFEERNTEVFKKVRHAFLNYALPDEALVLDGSLSTEVVQEKIRNEVTIKMNRLVR